MGISSATGADLYGFPGLKPYNSDSSFQGCKAPQFCCVSGTHQMERTPYYTRNVKQGLGVLTAVLSHLQDPLGQGQAGVRLNPPLGP